MIEPNQKKKNSPFFFVLFSILDESEKVIVAYKRKHVADL